ncbi:MAG: PAC2 family protein [Candidatus Helarchaeota archaeon]
MMKKPEPCSTGNQGEGVCPSSKKSFTQLKEMEGFDMLGINRKDLKQVEPKNPLCILGMPGVADIGKMSLDHLVNTLNAEKIMDIIFDDYPAGAIISDSLLYAPKAEVYYWKDPEEKQDVLLVTADAQPMSPKGIYHLSTFIASVMAEFNVKLIMALGGFPVDGKQLRNGAKIQATATDKELLEKYARGNVKKIGKGVVIGANGLIPTLAKRNHDIDGLVFLAETDGYQAMQQETYDLKASMALITMMGEHFNLPIETEFSEDNILVMETKLNDEKETIQEELGIKKAPSKVNLNFYG